MNNTQIFPTHLFIGHEQFTTNAAIAKIQKALCPNQQSPNPNCFCNECRKIKNAQHTNVIWLKPEDKYVIEDLDIIFEKIRFALRPDEKFFFVITNAHALSTVCANKLLKTLEEPAHGYFFFLLTHNEFAILPTIKSRSIVHLLTQNEPHQKTHPLLVFFQPDTKFCDPIAFEQELQKHDLGELESVNLVHEHLQNLRQQFIALQKNCAGPQELETLCTQKQFQILNTHVIFFETQLKKPPQAGSANLFWKKIFLTFPRQP